MATAMDDQLNAAVDALETQLQFLRDDLDRGERERVVFALQSMRFLASRLEEFLTNERVDEASRIAHGPPVLRRRVDGSVIRSAIVGILDEAGGPLAVKDIMSALEERGVKVPGQGRPANVVAYLNRMGDDVHRVGYGRYKLRRRKSRSRDSSSSK